MMTKWTKETEQELDRLIEKGTKAWAGTPDNWVDELRGGVEKMDKRTEFEKWHSHDGEWPQGLEKDAKGFYKYARTDNDWSVWQAAWKAARESMRQECIKLVYGMCESDNVAARTVEAIRQIEA